MYIFLPYRAHSYQGSWTGAFRAGLAIYRDGGVRGLFQGHSATLLRIFPYAAIKFMAYDQWRFVSALACWRLLPFQRCYFPKIIIPEKKYETNLRRFTTGALAGMSVESCLVYRYTSFQE